MIDYSEKRDFIRMPVQCPVSYRETADGTEETAELLDLSASGVRFVSQRAFDAGTRLHLRVRPERTITPPLEAEIAVLRCDADERGFDVAASIIAIAPPVVDQAD